MQSGVVLSLYRRFFKKSAKHIVFDIGSFNSASESGFALKLMQYASKSIDGIIYHTGSQIEYYKKYFPWIVNKCQFIRFGTDLVFFNPSNMDTVANSDRYILCVGYSKRDWNTLIDAYKSLTTDVKLRLIGHVAEEYSSVQGVEQLPFVPIQELIRQISNALFCVLPLESFNYSYGQMTLMQQMAMEKCVIAAKVPSLIDYVQDGKTAILYEPNDPSDLAKCISLLLEYPEKAKEIGVSARKYLVDECNEQIMAASIESFIKR